LEKYIKWFFATIGAGLTPILIRLFFFIFLVKGVSFQPIILSDIIAWGLIANISIFHERNGLFYYNTPINIYSTYITVVIIVFCIVMYIINLINEVSLRNGTKILFEDGSLFWAGVSVCLIMTILASIACCYFSMNKESSVPKKGT